MEFQHMLMETGKGRLCIRKHGAPEWQEESEALSQ
jgi:hypothetical protein